MCIDYIMRIDHAVCVDHADCEAEAGVVPFVPRPGLRQTPYSAGVDIPFSVLDNHLTGHVKDFLLN